MLEMVSRFCGRPLLVPVIRFLPIIQCHDRQPTNLTTHFNQPVNQPTSQTFPSINQPTNQPTNQSTNQCIRSKHQSTNKSLCQPMNPPMNPTKHYFNQPLSPSSQSTNQSGHQIFIILPPGLIRKRSEARCAKEKKEKDSLGRAAKTKRALQVRLVLKLLLSFSCSGNRSF